MQKGANIFWQKFKKGKETGQVAVLGILIICLIFLFVLITKSIGKYAFLRTQVVNAADGATLGLMSSLGSYSTYLAQQYLDGDDKDCQTGIGTIFSVLVLIVATIMTAGQFTWGWALLVAGLGAAGIAYNIHVVQESLEDLGRQFKAMALKYQFRESAMMDAMFRLVDDSKMVPDQHDWDGDGRACQDESEPNCDKISRPVAWLHYRLMVKSFFDTQIAQKLQEFIQFLSGLNYTAPDGTVLDCPNVGGCGYEGYYMDTTSSKTVIPGGLIRFLDGTAGFYNSDTFWSTQNNLKKWIEPGGLFQQIENTIPMMGATNFNLSFWTPGTGPGQVDELDTAMAEMRSLYEWADIFSEEICGPFESYEGHSGFHCNLIYNITEGEDGIDLIEETFPISFVSNIMPLLYNEALYETDPETNQPITVDPDTGEPIPPIVDFYDKVAGWHDDVTGIGDEGWYDKFTQWRAELQEIRDRLYNSACAAICESDPGSPLCAQCQAELTLRQRIDNEGVLEKFDRFIWLTGIFRDLIHNDANTGLADLYKQVEAEAGDKDLFYYSWTTNIKAYPWEPQDENGYKQIWHHLKVRTTVPALPYITGNAWDWDQLGTCTYLRNARDNVAVEVTYYTPDIPIYYVRGNNPLELLWRIKSRRNLQGVVNDAFNAATDRNGDGVIGYEDLSEGDQTRVENLLDTYGIRARSVARFNWRMHDNFLYEITE